MKKNIALKLFNDNFINKSTHFKTLSQNST